MKNSNFFTADVSFNVRDKSVHFKVVHNLPDKQGLSFNAALENWVHRTKRYTAESLCDYIRSKNTGFICMTMEEYEKITTEK